MEGQLERTKRNTKIQVWNKIEKKDGTNSISQPNASSATLPFFTHRYTYASNKRTLQKRYPRLNRPWTLSPQTFQTHRVYRHSGYDCSQRPSDHVRQTHAKATSESGRRGMRMMRTETRRMRRVKTSRRVVRVMRMTAEMGPRTMRMMKRSTTRRRWQAVRCDAPKDRGTMIAPGCPSPSSHFPSACCY